MKKSIFKYLACCMLVVMSSIVLFACGNPNDPTDLRPDPNQDLIEMTVEATDQKINISLVSDSKNVKEQDASVVAVKAYQYLEGDTISGLSSNIISINNISDNVVSTYTTGSTKTISLDRYTDENYDNLYNKYYLVANEKIIKGPVYTTTIQSKNTSTPALNIKSKKGIFGESASIYKDLGASHTVFNFAIEEMIYPNEIMEDGEAIEIGHPDNAYSFVSNGNAYYFNKAVVDDFDRMVADYSKFGAEITAIIVARPNSNEETFPQQMTYAPYSTQGTGLMGFNTSNEYGFDYFIATIEFLASRYSDSTFSKGFVSNYIIGNEIDYAKDYNRISEKQAPLDTYMEEYSRLMRITNLAVKKYNSNINVAIPVTQAWAEKGYILLGDQVQAYAPKQMIDWLNTKTKMEGDYNWGIAPHVYGYHLPQAGVYYLDTLQTSNGGKGHGMTNDFNTSKITFSNLELLDDYLNQDIMKVNGQTRNVYLTESGVSSYWNNENYGGLDIQAGIIASAYYKISQLDTIKSFCYYRAIDNASEVQNYALFGLQKQSTESKPAYNVYKYIDTQYSQKVADKYLSSIQYFDENGNLVTANSYLELLNIFNTNHDFSNFDWDKATPVTAETIYEYEDKIDLDGIKFESKSFLFDGAEHSLSVEGELPEGVTVSYSENNSLSNLGKESVMATFKQGDEIVGRRVANLEVTKILTNKKVYNLGEKVFVTMYRDSNLSKSAWIGIYKDGDEPNKNDAVSVYWYSFNQNDDILLRTVCLQEQEDNLQGGLKSGKYTIYYFTDGGYTYTDSTQIEISSSKVNTVDLSNVSFADTVVTEDEEPHSILISGDLPTGVTVSYEGNEQSAVGSYQIKATFSKDGYVLETRYAVLTIEANNIDRLTLNKTEYVEGEDILVTAIVPKNSQPSTWWVGLYLKDDSVEQDESIYWFYVVTASVNNSGNPVNIKLTSHNSSRGDYVDIPAGTYKMVLFNTSGYTVERQVEFVVKQPTTIETGSISANKTTLNVGEDLLVTAVSPESKGQKTYWVGLYLSTDSVEADESIYWYYVKDETHTSGTTYNIKEQLNNKTRVDLKDLPAGNYKLVLFSSGYTVESQIEITITQA